LKSHAEGMSVITNNLANVNTVGYKQMAMQYSDMISQYMTTSAGTTTNTSQVGAGAVPGANRTLFTQGGLETGSSATDISINGIGFFGVTKNGQTHYTRAGDFRFTKTGELLDPAGWNLLGRAIVNGVESATVSPIQLDLSPTGFGEMPAEATGKISVGNRLGGLEDKNSVPGNPFFAMAASYDSAASPPVAGFSYSEPVTFYDANGDKHAATVYYDKAGSTGGLTAVEYVVAFSPAADASSLAKSKAAGLLMAGTMTFASNGEMINLTAFTPPSSGEPSDLAGWTPAGLQGGQPVLNAVTAGSGGQDIVLDFGLTFTDSGASAGGGLASAAEADATAIFNASASRKLGERATVMLGEQPGSFHVLSDGYPRGDLLDVQVTADGIIRGVYNNNQNRDICRISLYRFTSQDGLYHEGNNHYSATRESGVAEEGRPGQENLGTLAEYSLEQSNVDYAREFSLLIVTQRGFQMNSKIITTSDTMLQRALELKR
jgi:flagellar hook protein FlgE